MTLSPSSRYPIKRPASRIGTMIIPTDPYWIQAYEGLLRTAEKLGDELVVLEPIVNNEDLNSTSSNDLVEMMLANQLGVLITTLSASPFIREFLNAKLPVIVMSEMEFTHPFLTSGSSLYEGGRIAGQYLAERLRGHENVVCFTATLEKSYSSVSRLAGFRDVLHQQKGIQVEEISGFWTYAESYRAFLEILAKYPRRIDAYFGISDTLALAARDAGSKLGIIDDQTIKVGLNGDPMVLAAIVDGSFAATIDTSSEKLGEKALYLAHNMVRGGKQIPYLQQTFQLITRENVADIAIRKLTAIAGIPTYMVGYSRQQEKDRLSQLKISTEISHQIGSLLEPSQLISGISGIVRKHYGYDWLRILRWSDNEQTLSFFGGEESPASEKIHIQDDPLLLYAFQRNETVFIMDTRTSQRWQFGEEWDAIRSRAVLPILLGETVIGVLDLQAAQPIQQPTLEIVGLKLLASQLGIAIQNSDLYLDAVQARAAAERANELKTRLVANVGHEMRTPLNSILGFSQSIQKKLTKGETVQLDELAQDVTHIYRSGEHLMFMINDLLDLSRAEIGALNLYFEPIQPASFLKEVFADFAQPERHSSQVNWTLEIPDQLPIIRADEVRLRQVVINLLSNASKYTHRGCITLGASVDLPYLHLWVKDTGPGVPIDLQNKIFEPFGVVGRKRRSEGIGLGLSITRHLVNLHGGFITLDSQMGKGSVFNIYLPLPGVALDLNAGTVTSPGQMGEALLLVISQSQQVPDELLQVCGAHKLKPYLVRDREELIQALSAGTPASVAWDLKYASPDEWALVYQLSNEKKYAALPVILFGVEQTGGRLAAGMTNVVFKPCHVNALTEWISGVSMAGNGEQPILVVDDDPEARDFYRGLLKNSHPNTRVIYAENGTKALDLLQIETPALILLDLVMPEMDGFAVLERVRAESRTRCIPVVIISGKLLNYEDIQRLNYLKTTYLSKGILNEAEAVRLLGQVGQADHVLPQPTSLLIKQSLSFMHQNYFQPVSRKDIAAAVGVSENYLSQIFREEMGISLLDYLTRFRIQKSQELLVNSQDSITRIALQVGFNDSAYFSRVFHKMVGKSPLEFRQSRN